MLSGTRANIAMKMFGDDLQTLRALATQVEAAARSVPGVVDLSVEQQTDIPTVTVKFDRGALASSWTAGGRSPRGARSGHGRP